LKPCLGFVLNHEIEPTAIFDRLGRIELDKKFFLRGKSAERSQYKQAEQRERIYPHDDPVGSGEIALVHSGIDLLGAIHFAIALYGNGENL
jgi:hypothetical protein